MYWKFEFCAKCAIEFLFGIINVSSRYHKKIVSIKKARKARLIQKSYENTSRDRVFPAKIGEYLRLLKTVSLDNAMPLIKFKCILTGIQLHSCCPHAVFVSLFLLYERLNI